MTSTKNSSQAPATVAGFANIREPVSPAITNVAGNADQSGVISPEAEPHSPAALWARRILFVAFVLVSLWAGIVLLIAPWTAMWTNNSFLLRNLALRGFAMHGFVRGAVSGLGLINLWIGVWDGVHYREK